MQRQRLPIIGFLGFGKMAEAISTGVLSSDPSWKRIAYDPFRKDMPVSIESVSSVAELEEQCELLLLCVKPQDMQSALVNLKGHRQYISIAAGLTVSSLQSMFACEDRIARVMPNLCATIGMSVNAVYCTNESLFAFVHQVFTTVGPVFRIKKEDTMHAVTGLSGSGPAFIFRAIEALAEAGIHEGLSSEDSLAMATWTVKGAAELLIRSQMSPGELIHDVASPAGTTIRGLHSLEQSGFKASLMNAVLAASNRSRELS